ncbi:MAG: ABC-F type ribosomal protection protein [Oscillospiraceae bacterium]|nr:ABC-F type ribosomal protection protein [Oscillospiraceae bacterium]
MAQIKVTDLSFAYPGSYDNIFEHTSFQIDSDWKLGFIGRNGRGKTTFLKLLMGEYPYQGQIEAPMDFDYFPFPVPQPDRIAGELCGEIAPEVPRWRLLRETAALGLDEELLQRSFDTLSKGEQTKLLLALLFARENRFLLIDEPTNHLDIRGRELVSRYLSGKKGFILVSHDRAFLDGCVDHILSINRADIEVQRGNFSSWWENRQRRDAYELAENERLKKDIRRLKETAREKAQWSDTAERRKKGAEKAKADNIKGWAPLQGAKSKKQMARAKAIEGRLESAIEEKEGLLKNREEAEALKLAQLPFYTDRLAELRELAIDYGAGPLFSPLSLTLRTGERVALLGPNGCGKSSVLKLVCGEEIPHTGLAETASRLKISYVPQDASFLRGDLKSFARERDIDESLFKTILRKLDLSRVQFEKDMADFSAGQKKKVLIAASLCEKAHLHVWDEPMNYIDLYSRMQLEDLILRCAPTLLFVEHDRAFCERVATATVTI